MFNIDNIGLVKNRKEFEYFVNILPELKEDEVYFISLSARNKYLNNEEREYYSLGKTEMFAREIANDREYLKNRTIQKLEGHLYGRRTNNGKLIPDKALVCYININPSSVLKSYMLFKKEMDNQMNEITTSLRNNLIPNYDYMLLQHTKLMNCIQKSLGSKYFIDIDCDTKEFGVYNFIHWELKRNNIQYHVIESKNGYHFLLVKDTIPVFRNKGNLKRSYNVLKLCEDAKLHSGDKDVEITINSNSMVPVPGTNQSNFLVTIIR